MEFKGTKGPWISKENPIVKNEYVVKSGNKEMIASVKFQDFETDDEVKANANLISSAPELLEALELAEKTLRLCQNHVDISGFVFKDIRKAINKALGK